jgi:hypothetical protein
VTIPIQIVKMQLMANGVPIPANVQRTHVGELGRFGAFSNVPPLAPDSFFDVFFGVDFPPPPPPVVMTELMGMGVVPGAPHGSENLYPMGMGTMRVRHQPGTGPALDSFFDIFVQLRFDGMTQGSGAAPMALVGPMTISPTPTGYFVQARVMQSKPGTSPLVGLAVSVDHRGFSRPSGFMFCPGDTNGDALVSFTDLNTVLSQFGQSGAGLSGDVNGDGVVNFGDLNVVLSGFGRNCGPPQA